MTEALIRCTLRSANNAPKDDVQNDFAAVYTEGVADPEEVVQAFATFYTENTTLGASVGEYINASIARTDGLMVELVVDPGTPPNAPFMTRLFDLPPAAASTSLPQETAICLSFNDAEYLTSPNPGRHRGRVYIGPLIENAIQTVAGGYARPSGEVVTTIMEAAARLRDDFDGVDGLWAIWSRADAAFYAVSGGWVDNEFDTQRRRGHVSSVRNTW